MKAHQFIQIVIRIHALILLAAGMLAAGPMDAVGSEPAGNRRQLLVRFEPGLHAASRGMTHAEVGASRAHRFRRIPVEVVTVPEGANLEEYIADYETRPGVTYAEPNYTIRLQNEPNDPLFGDLWGLDNTGQTDGTAGADIGALEAWEHTTGSSEVVVAVIDTGVYYTHEDLTDNMWENPEPEFDDIHGARWTDGDGTLTSGDPMDDNSHGTHVAGTIGAVGDNGRGVAGVNWDIQLMALRFMDDAGMGAVSDAISAIEYAIDHGADIINASWGTEDRSDSLEAILQQAADANVLVAASAGNDGSDNDDTPFFPASFDLPNIISVASSTAEDTRSSFSNWGKESVHLAAPGSQIKSTMPDNDYGYKAGTSMAAPHVAGAAALFYSLNSRAGYEMVKAKILETVTPLEAWEDVVIAGGRLNVGALVRTAEDTGELTIAIFPEDIGAQWRVVGEDAWLDSGDSVTLQIGEYEIEFAVLDHWVEPDPLTVDVVKDTLTSETANYQRARGALQVTIEPEDAVGDGAQWTASAGNTWQDSGERITRQTGTYEVEFAELEGWVAPNPVTVNIVKDTLTSETGQYECAHGSLEVSIEPQGARQDGAQWRVTGEATWRDSGDRLTLETGEHEVEFADSEGWVAPNPVTVNVTQDTVTSETIEYERAQGSLEVSIDPQGARQDGAQWRV
ncbi:MAG: S8 family peptidase, partial [Candidatus Hydrogenedentota bacterium]